MTKHEKEEFQKLKDAALAKINIMNYNELKDFVMGTNRNEICLDATYENLRTSLDYIVYSYNNTSNGIPSAGGQKFKRCIINISNSELAPKEMNIKIYWYVPSGILDGNMSGVYKEETYVLTNKDIYEIKVRGSAREYLKQIIGIKDELIRKDEKPYQLPELPIQSKK